MYHGQLNLNVKIKHITRNFVIWHTIEYSKCVLQHNLVKCLGNKGFCDHIILRNTTK